MRGSLNLEDYLVARNIARGTDIDRATQLVVSFSLALGASILLSLALAALAVRTERAPYEFSRLREQVSLIAE